MIAAAVAAVVLGLIFLPVTAAGKVADETGPVSCQQISCQQPQSIPDKIRVWAKADGADPALAVCIAQHESGFDPSAKNASSTAAGVFQFLRGTFDWTAQRMGEPWSYDAGDVFDEDKNIQAGTWLLAHDGPSPWVVWQNGSCGR